MRSGRACTRCGSGGPSECDAIILTSHATGKKVPTQFEAGCRFPQRHNHDLLAFREDWLAALPKSNLMPAISGSVLICGRQSVPLAI